MKKQTLNLSIGLIAFFLLTSSSKPKIDYYDKQYVKLKDSLYVGIYEVTNKDYKSFLNDLKLKQNNEELKQCNPDTNQWTSKIKFSYLEPFKDYYFSHPSYKDFPVVNITKEAANKYCDWLTNYYNSQPKKIFKKVLFRLPTEKEWIHFASALPGNSLPWYGNFAYDANLKYFANVKFENKGYGTFNYTADNSFAPSKCGRYEMNKKGLYDIIGNVAELTETGIIKGGSWDNLIDECGVDKNQDFQLPDPRVGFRVVMVIVEK
jgi:formylglycine-generating enzyme required for sulfatase activity